MAKNNSTGTTINLPSDLSFELHAIAATLAGLEEVLRSLVEESEVADTLYMLAGVTAHANEQICITADRVSSLSKMEN